MNTPAPLPPLEILLVICQIFILVYFSVLNLSYALLTYFGFRYIARFNQQLSPLMLNNLLQLNIYKPISLLVPAYNEEKTIIASVRSFLSLHYPEFEVIVVSDGSKDRTIDVLIEAYQLYEVGDQLPYHENIVCQDILRAFRSRTYSNLIVLEKKNGGKADALNAALKYSRHDLVCAVDADSVLDVEALVRTARMFVEDETVIAVGGTIRPLNGSVVENGQLLQLRLPKSWIERVQVIEYCRAFFTGRAGWAEIDAMLIISGAFGVFSRQAMLEIGGYNTSTVGEDIELVVRLHKKFRQAKVPYRILFCPDPLCWTEVPDSFRVLRRQRNRWQRGLFETLWSHRDMTFNPRYGRMGMISMPFAWLFDAFSPIIEIIGYIFIPISFAFGILDFEFAALFLLLVVIYGIMLSYMSLGIEVMMQNRYPRLEDRVTLMLVTLTEFIYFRQILLWERFIALFQVWRKRGQWGAMERKGLK
jgi:cellulose synthase/poly-beta-1,6-N-acetylglucosamine synthase-like glycosyltransferase